MARSLKSNILFQYGLQTAKYIFPFVTIPYLTRVLGPDVYAVRAYILAAMTFIQVFLDFGFASHGTRMIALANGDNCEESLHTTAICLLRAGLCLIGIIVVVLLIVFIPILHANPVYVWIAYLGICFKATLPDFIFQGREDMGIITYRFVGSQTVSTVLVFVLVTNSNDLLWVPALETLASFIAWVWSWISACKQHGVRPKRISLSFLKRCFSEASIYFVSNASTTIFTSLTTLMIGIFITDEAQISYWSISMTAITAIQSLYSPITNSVYPRIVKTMDFSLIKKFLILGLPLVLIAMLGFILFRDFIMLVIGGGEYIAGSYILALVSPVLILSYPAMLLGYPVLAAVGQSRKLTTTSVVSAIFHILGLVVLAIFNIFTIPAVCVLRCATEAVLMITRGWYAYKVIKDSKLK